MAIVPDESPTSAPEVDFGANDWLLEEMYEQYTADPSSVDETWAEYFKSHGAPSAGAGDGAAARSRSRKPGPAAEAPSRAVVQPTPTAAAARTGARAGLAHRPAAACSQPRPVALRRLRSPRQLRRSGRARPGARGGGSGRSAEPCRPAERRARGAGQDHHCAGHPARTAKNMDVSLDGADRDQRPVAAGQAAHRPARGDQQPPAPGPGRQGLLHPPHRLRHGAGAEDACRR